MLEAVAVIDQSISLLKRLREISKNIETAEFRNLLGDLSNSLGDAKLEIGNLKEQVAALREENRQLKTVASNEAEQQPTMQFGCYKFQGEGGLFCPGCWASKGRKSPAVRLPGGHYQCTVCRVQLS